MDELTTKQLRERMSFLGDKMENIWTKIGPSLDEFGECRAEFDQIVEELVKRGVIERGEDQ